MQITEDNERIAAEAADWFILNQDDGPVVDEEQHRRFTQWLESSPRHAEEYLEIAQLGRDLSKIPAIGGLSVDALVERARGADDCNVIAIADRLPAEKVAPSSRRQPWLPFAAAAALVMAIAGWQGSALVPGLRKDPQVKELRVASTPGQSLTQTLEDGSVLQLHKDSAVTVRFTATERRIDMERGRAVFTVRHETARPFRVIAGEAQVLDIGTKFDVYLHPETTIVTVLEGKVQVGSQRAAGKLDLVAGQQVRVRAGELPAVPLNVDVESETAYLPRKIAVLETPLAAVVAEYNRHSRVPIQIGTPGLGQMKISGSFAVDDTDFFLAWLRQQGMHVDVTPTRILVSGS